ncbi:hypothetical protein ACQQ2N_20580 [Dokdonella sp. MW10]|uniref:hypothetical protein n=1 Tax=Dokdonella sp. MW10 TaxID=2992926 RepID=UPI003F7CE061
MTRTRRLALPVLLAMFAGCSEDAPQAPARRATDATAPASPAAPPRAWLAHTDATPPTVWLARHAEGDDREADAAAIARATRSLDAAARAYTDPPRMLANRAVQLRQMLDHLAPAEDAITLLDALASMPVGHGGRDVATDVQHYANLRRQGHDHADALARLAASRHGG